MTRVRALFGVKEAYFGLLLVTGWFAIYVHPAGWAAFGAATAQFLWRVR